MEFLLNNECLFYDIKGKGQPLIILHAMGTDHRSMAAWIEPLFDSIDGWQRVYIDIPAHGNSNKVNDIKSTQDMLNLILAFISSTFHNRSFALLGHSFGGYLAQGIMSERLNLVKGICLLAPALHLIERRLPHKEILERDNHLIEALDSDIQQSIHTLLVNQTEDYIDLFLKEIQPGRLLANREFLQSNWREQGYFLKQAPLQNKEEITQPSLMILGKQDAICGYMDHLSLLKRFKYLTFSILNNTGHLMQIEKRNLVQELVRDWIRTLK
ncbi:alpha/beta hydrolase [Bacillus sp. FJAT-49736]|uniref:alpha/beta fold hydrolase n=1 Tax=Bacillus sp. FJAT-49736 TaxID=2833582 RepID=UPI001BC8F31D|nr:alpha/beta hydrolase [Bacillus sp. FJAT-49736]MBS4175055.1 alpha/beta hydrolase [Bacillus sp. FJAT-49736]